MVNQLKFYAQTQQSQAALELRLRDHLRQPIFKIGTRLPSERELAEELGVGRTALRPLLDALEKEGVLERRPQSGTFLRGLPTRRATTDLVVLVTPLSRALGIDAEVAWNHAVTLAFETAVRMRGVELSIRDDSSKPIEEMAQRALEDGAKVVIFLRPQASNEALLRTIFLLHGNGVHAIISKEEDGPGMAGAVFFDKRWGGYLASQHLSKFGHRRVGFIVATENQRFVHGYRWDSPEGGDNWIWSNASDAVETWLTAPSYERPTALVAATETLGIELLQAARSEGISIPKDLSVISLGNGPGALLAGLTAVDTPGQKLGEELARVALDRLAQGEAGVSVTHRLQPLLIERRTVGPPAPDKI
jgi:DNA-binding LacI/PurR family transcriptional regulator